MCNAKTTAAVFYSRGCCAGLGRAGCTHCPHSSCQPVPVGYLTPKVKREQLFPKNSGSQLCTGTDIPAEFFPQCYSVDPSI